MVIKAIIDLDNGELLEATGKHRISALDIQGSETATLNLTFYKDGKAVTDSSVLTGASIDFGVKADADYTGASYLVYHNTFSASSDGLTFTGTPTWATAEVETALGNESSVKLHSQVKVVINAITYYSQVFEVEIHNNVIQAAGSTSSVIFPRLITTTSDPTANDDSLDGYGVSSIWLNTSNNYVYVLMNNTAGAAVWKTFISSTLTAALNANNNKITNLTDGTASSDAATKGQLDALVNGAPDNLNTLDEIAAALNDDNSIAATLTNNIATKLPLAGGTLTGALNFGDNINAQFGDSQQLKIYHNGANNAFIENSTTYLVLESSAIILRNTAGNEDYAKFLGDGGCEFYFNNSKKLETTTEGISVTGKIQSSDGSASAPSVSFSSDTDTGLYRATANNIAITAGGSEVVRFDDNLKTTTKGAVRVNGSTTEGIVIASSSTASQGLKLFNNSSTDDASIINHYSGNLIFGTGNTEAARFDSSGRLGIGGTPSELLDVHGAESKIKLTSTSHSRDTIFQQGGGHFHIKTSHANGVAINNGSSSAGQLGIYNSSTESIRLAANGDSYFNGGNVGIGGSPSEKFSILNTGGICGMNLKSASDNLCFIDFGDSDDGNIGGINYNNSDDTLNLRAGNANRLTVNASGNVGIASTNPQAKLEINGGTGVTSSGGTLVVRQKGDTFNDGIALTSSHANSHRIWKDGNSTLFIGSTVDADAFAQTLDGKIGIGGVTAPSQVLEVGTNTDVSAQIGRARVGHVSFDDHAGFSHLDRASASGYALLQSSSGDTFLNAETSRSTYFRKGNTTIGGFNSSGQFYVNNNCGIGTTAPVSPLTVESNLNALADADEPENYHLLLRNPNNDTTEGVGMGFLVSGATSDVGGSIICKRTGDNAKSELQFWNKQNTSIDGVVTQAMTIADNGNVGIGGVTSPVVKLDVHGDFMLTNTTPRLILKESGSSKDMNLKVQTDGRLDILDDNQANILATVLQNGNVGIGTTSPSAKMHIDVTTEDNQPAFKISKASDQGENALEVLHNTNSAQRGIADFTNANGSVLYLRGDGNVGIGTTSPRTSLHVSTSDADDDPSVSNINGPFFISNSSNSFGLEAGVSSSGHSWIQSHSVVSDAQYGLNLNPLGGNVGIGTTGPSEKLTIDSGNVQLTNGNYIIFDGPTPKQTKMRSYYDGSQTHLAMTVSNNAVLDLAADGDITQNYINYTDGSNYEALQISAESDHIKYDTTSIGSFASNTREHRFNVNNSTKFRVSSSGVLNYGHYYIVGNYELNNSWNDLILTTSTQTDNDIIFKPNNTEAVRITGAGRLGVGTGSPQQKAHIVGGGLQISGNITTPASGQTGLLLDYYQGGSRYWSRGADSTTRGTHSFYSLESDGGNQITSLFINTSGLVGISTTTPSSYADLTLGNGRLCMAETTTPTADANFGKVYCKSDNKLYFQDGAGTEHEIAFA